MKAKSTVKLTALALLALSTLNPQLSTARAQGTAFTYQGRLNDGANPANGTYDLRFAVYDALTVGTQQGSLLTNSATAVSNGLFTVTLDFGNQFPGANRWLEIGVRTNGAANFFTLTPRQALTPAPYAIMAGNLTGVVPSSGVAGTYSSPVTFNNAANSFTGDGSGLANVNALTLGGIGAAGFWQTIGNAGTSAGPNFLGTTDNQPLEVRVNNTRVLRLEPDGRGLNAGNLIGGHPDNQIQQPGSGGDVIAGGGFGSGGGNIIYSNSAGVIIGAGSGNRVGPNAFDSTILGGLGHSVQSSDSVVGGGYNNTIQSNANSSFIGGGGINSIQTNSQYSTIGGGNYNTIQPNTSYATIGGGFNNIIQTNSNIAMIGGGHDNTIQSASFSIIGGGGYNLIELSAYDAVIGGGGYNTIQTNAHSSFIGGGGGNTIQVDAPYSTIGGGLANVIQTNAPYSTIGGGYNNTIQSNDFYSTMAGGGGNTIQPDAPYSAIGGGILNTIQTHAQNSTIGGGYYNTIQSNAYYATIPGGYGNVAAGNYSFAAGQQAQALHQGSFVWADSQNAVFASSGPDQFLIRAGGGIGINKTNPVTAFDVNGTVSASAFVGSGSSLTALDAGQLTGTIPGAVLTNAWKTTGNAGTSPGANFMGTTDNQPLEIRVNNSRAVRYTYASNGSYGVVPNLVGGFDGNFVSNGVVGAVIAGGGAANFGTNQVLSDLGTVSGGLGNSSSGSAATVGGGAYNASAGPGTAIGGGYANFSSGYTAVVAGGNQNTNTGGWSAIGGGVFNVAGGFYATVPGGISNSAVANFSFAAGQRAKANHTGSFVWADSQSADFASTINDTFNVRAANGLRVSDGNNGNVNIQTLNGAGTGYHAINFNGFYNGTEQRYNPNKDRWRLVVDQRSSADMMSIDVFNGSTVSTLITVLTNGNVGIGTTAPTNKLHVLGGATFTSGVGGANQNVVWIPGSASWSFTSDRNTKDRIQPVDAQCVLEKVSRLPIAEWSYIGYDQRHIGPMAQDFHAQFPLNGDDKALNDADLHGVALAAIQGLNEKVESGKQTAETQIQELKAENAELKARLEKLEQIMIGKNGGAR